MAAIASATTVYANAYLTELGRTYLFDSPDTPRYTTLDNGQTIDRLQIQRFSLGDSDVNYGIAELLKSGQVPDVSGDSETAVKGAKGRTLTNLISPGDTTLISDSITTLAYKTTNDNVAWDLGTNILALPTVITQQLMTFIDGLLVSDGAYNVSPTTYGKIKSVNGELIIPIKNPTTTAAGYRLRIFYPKTGANYNKMTFQFEKSDPIQSVIISNTNTQTITAASAVAVNTNNLTTL
jgi:hypothetical protein